MKLLKRWKDHPDILKEHGLPVGWFDVENIEGEIDRLSSYWIKDTIKPLLKNGNILPTPSAFYKIKQEDK